MADAAKLLAPVPGAEISRVGLQNYKFVGRAQESISSIQKVCCQNFCGACCVFIQSYLIHNLACPLHRKFKTPSALHYGYT